MPEWLSQTWKYIVEHKQEVFLISAILSIIGGVMTLWSRAYTALKRQREAVEGKKAPDVFQPLLPLWPEGQVACSFPIQRIAKGAHPAPQTRVLLLDRGQPQASLEPRPYSAADIRTILQRHNLGKHAIGLQYLTVPVRVTMEIPDGETADGFKDVKTEVVANLKVDDANASRLVDWHLNVDGKVDLAEVCRTLVAVLKPWLSLQLRQRAFERLCEEFMALQAEAQEILAGALAQHGLLVAVESFSFQSADYEAAKQRAADDLGAWLQKERERLSSPGKSGS